MWSCKYCRILREILKEITTEYSLEGLMLKLKFYTLHLMWRVNTLEKTLMLENIEDRRNRGQQRMRWLDDITDSMDMSLSNLVFEMVKDGETWHAAVHGVTKSQTQLSIWTTTILQKPLNDLPITPFLFLFKVKLIFNLMVILFLFYPGDHLSLSFLSFLLLYFAILFQISWILEL